jgi:hypothetical protein
LKQRLRRHTTLRTHFACRLVLLPVRHLALLRLHTHLCIFSFSAPQLLHSVAQSHIHVRGDFLEVTESRASNPTTHPKSKALSTGQTLKPDYTTQKQSSKHGATPLKPHHSLHTTTLLVMGP